AVVGPPRLWQVVPPPVGEVLGPLDRPPLVRRQPGPQAAAAGGREKAEGPPAVEDGPRRPEHRLRVPAVVPLLGRHAPPPFRLAASASCIRPTCQAKRTQPPTTAPHASSASDSPTGAL